MKNCPKCGSEMDDDLKLCSKCAAESEQPTPEEPAQDAPVSAPETAECEYSDPVQPPKKNTKKIVLMAALALLVIGAVVACILLLSKPDPETVVKDAYAKTAAELEDVFANAPNLSDAIGITSDLISSEKFALGFELDATLPIFTDEGQTKSVPYGIEASGSLNADTAEGAYSGELTVSSGMNNRKTDFDLLFSLNDDSIIFQMPTCFDGSYGVAIGGDMSDRFDNSYMFEVGGPSPSLELSYLASLLRTQAESKSEDAETDEKSFAESCEKLRASFEYEASDAELPKCDGLDLYKVSYDKKAFKAVVKELGKMANAADEASFFSDFDYALPPDFFENLQKHNVTIYVGIDESGRLASVTLYDDNDYFTLRLSGKTNLWDSFALYSNTAKIISGSFKATKSGFKLEVTMRDDFGYTLVCDDESGELSFTMFFSDDDENALELELGYELVSDKTGVKCTLDVLNYLSLDLDVEVSLTLKPLKGEITMLDTEFADILDFSEKEYQDFMLALIDGLYDGALSQIFGDDFTYENVFGAAAA